MSEKPAPRKVRLTDPKALRAYAHPTRMALAGLLRREGPLTATQAAGLTGESVASCSYHLRVLAKYGLVEEADPDGPGREKPWRATAEYTDWPSWSEDPVTAEAAEALTLAVAENFLHRMARAVDTRRGLSREWQEAERFTDVTLYLTPQELSALGERIDALIDEYTDRAADPSLRPPGARRVPYLQIGYVAPEPPAGRPAEQVGEQSGEGADGGPYDARGAGEAQR
ncbi:winged helix-turn-helix domain-containing protein [Actinacidiphila yeochonensis]|uniref:winged helix-turn-helix domain-containing protein n=1 Tax=Actinacidiphila yeochonensis TaxID=89050 RepID=UPI0007C677FA|nr:helix-turn-helix domain-containing protein [Actinacidiphila yeochonensis]